LCASDDNEARPSVVCSMTEDRFGIVGKIVARTYQVKDVVAEGGFGVVYRAHHQGFRAEVALKCLKIPGELTEAQRRSFLEQFRSEAEVLFRLSAQNAHIVRPLHVDAFHTKDQRLVPFMALEWLEGRTLDALIIQRAEKGRPPLSLENLVRLLTPVAAALEQAHNLPGTNGPETVIHRDMKPENLFIARIGGHDVAKILDFGISKVKSTAGQLAGRASVNEDALVSFSPAYGAPEQWAPKRFGQTGRWTDVWGLALTVVEAAKGDEVVTGDHQEMMGTILDPGRRPTPRTEGVVVSDAVERIFARALAVDPRERYQAVGAFWDDLTQALGIQEEVGGPVSIREPRPMKRPMTGFDSIRPAAMPKAAPAVGAGSAPVSHHAATEVDLAGAKSNGLARPGNANLGAAVSSRSQGNGGPGPQSLARPALGSYTDASRGELRAAPAASPSGNAYAASRTYARPSYSPGRASVWKTLSPAFALMALSVGLTVFDRAFAHSKGVPLSFGPVQASWVAGGLMIIALINGFTAVKRNWLD
jgi:serine/threonine protein kinase